MKKSTQFRICNWSLLGLTLVALASGIQLEATHSQGLAWVWLHIVVCSLFTGAVIWHLALHFKWSGWFSKLRSQKSPVTRWMAVFGGLTLVTAIITTVHWLVTAIHSPIGGLHGKLGFIFMALAIGHTVGRIKFYTRLR